jgi:Nucleotidyltransferase/DNA polymerase involved in DNA repair
MKTWTRFCASVEQRDDPQLQGKPVIAAWRGNCSVVCASWYALDFTRYRAVSRQAREIFLRDPRFPG